MQGMGKYLEYMAFRIVYGAILQDGQFYLFYGGKHYKWSKQNSFFFFFFTGLWLQLWKHVVMKTSRSKSYQEINSELNEALVLLKLTRQLEKVLHIPLLHLGHIMF